MGMELKGIDISTWQGPNLDFKKLKKSGVNFAIIRAGFGTGNKDSQFENNYSKAKKAGMPVGAYWYSYALSAEGARAEAQSCISMLKGKQFEYPIYFDLEDPTQASLPKSTKTDMVVAFCEELENAGYFAGVYSNLSWLRNELEYERIKAYTIWLAQWYKEPTYENPFAVWQYGVDTFNGMQIDADICYEDFPAIMKSAGLNGYPKTTEESKKPETPKPDKKPEPTKPAKKPVTSQVVDDVINGKYGNGKERFEKLEAEGYDSGEVQDAVNAKLYGPDLKVGDRVKIKLGSAWAPPDTGHVPAWVTQQRLYVRSTPNKDGICAVSTLSSGAITGHAYTKDLVKD